MDNCNARQAKDMFKAAFSNANKNEVKQMGESFETIEHPVSPAQFECYLLRFKESASIALQNVQELANMAHETFIESENYKSELQDLLSPEGNNECEASVEPENNESYMQDIPIPDGNAASGLPVEADSNESELQDSPNPESNGEYESNFEDLTGSDISPDGQLEGNKE